MTLSRSGFAAWTALTALLGGLLGALAAQHGVPTLKIQHEVSARHLLVFTTPSALRTNTQKPKP
jgi:uncharacterized membrane protein (DUF441 family)